MRSLTLQRISLNTRGLWITTRRACQSSSRFLRGYRVSLVLSISLPSRLISPTDDHVHATDTANADRGIPDSGEAHRSTACDAQSADAPRCVRSPPCPIHPRAFTARNDARRSTREERERDSSRQTPLINTRHPPRRPRIPSRSSLDHAREFRRSE